MTVCRLLNSACVEHRVLGGRCLVYGKTRVQRERWEKGKRDERIPIQNVRGIFIFPNHSLAHCLPNAFFLLHLQTFSLCLGSLSHPSSNLYSYAKVQVYLERGDDATASTP